MATQSRRSFMTYEEFEALPREGMITMLLDGEYVVLASPIDRHQELVGRFYFELRGFLQEHPDLGRVHLAPLDVVLSKPRARVIQPDLFFIPRGNQAQYEKGIVMGAPALAIEVLSPDANRHDKGKKLEYYDEYGTQELWHSWRDRPLVEVYRRDAEGRLRKALDLGPGDSLTTPLLPGFSLSIDLLYRDLP